MTDTSAKKLHAAIARKIIEGIKDSMRGDDDLWAAVDLCLRDELDHEATYAELRPHTSGFSHIVLLHVAGEEDGHEVALNIRPVWSDMDEDSIRYEIAAYRRLAAELEAHAAKAEAELGP